MDILNKIITYIVIISLFFQNNILSGECVENRKHNLKNDTFLRDKDFQGTFDALVVIRLLIKTMRKEDISFNSMKSWYRKPREEELKNLPEWAKSHDIYIPVGTEAIFEDTYFQCTNKDIWIHGPGWRIRFFDPDEEIEPELATAYIKFGQMETLNRRLAYQIYINNPQLPDEEGDGDRNYNRILTSMIEEARYRGVNHLDVLERLLIEDDIPIGLGIQIILYFVINPSLIRESTLRALVLFLKGLSSKTEEYFQYLNLIFIRILMEEGEDSRRRSLLDMLEDILQERDTSLRVCIEIIRLITNYNITALEKSDLEAISNISKRDDLDTDVFYAVSVYLCELAKKRMDWIADIIRVLVNLKGSLNNNTILDEKKKKNIEKYIDITIEAISKLTYTSEKSSNHPGSDVTNLKVPGLYDAKLSRGVFSKLIQGKEPISIDMEAIRNIFESARIKDREALFKDNKVQIYFSDKLPKTIAACGRRDEDNDRLDIIIDKDYIRYLQSNGLFDIGIAEVIDHEWTEYMEGKGHRAAAQREKKYFSHDGKGALTLTPYHTWVISERITASQLKAIVAEYEKMDYGNRINRGWDEYEDLFYYTAMARLFKIEEPYETGLGRLRKSYENIIESERLNNTAAMGDIHGNWIRLMELINEVEQDAKQIDKYIFLGDYMDRGQQGLKVIEMIMKMTAEGRAVPLMGNHELMFIMAMMGDFNSFMVWLGNGGRAVLDEAGISYDGSIINTIEEAANLGNWGFVLTDPMISVLENLHEAVQNNLRLKMTALWMQRNLRLYHIDEKGTLYMHAGLPIDDQGNVVLKYHDYTGMEALGKMEEDMLTAFRNNDLEADVLKMLTDPYLSPLWVRTTTSGMPISDVIDINGPDKLLEQLGVVMMVTGHNPVDKVKNVGNVIFGINVRIRLDCGAVLWNTQTGIEYFEFLEPPFAVKRFSEPLTGADFYRIIIKAKERARRHLPLMPQEENSLAFLLSMVGGIASSLISDPIIISLAIIIILILGVRIYFSRQERRIKEKKDELYRCWERYEKQPVPVRGTELLDYFYTDSPAYKEDISNIIKGIKIDNSNTQRIARWMSDEAHPELRDELQGYRITSFYKGRIYRFFIREGENDIAFCPHNPFANKRDEYVSLGNKLTKKYAKCFLREIEKLQNIKTEYWSVVSAVEERDVVERLCRDNIFAFSVFRNFPQSNEPYPSFKHKRYIFRPDNEVIANYFPKGTQLHDRGIIGRPLDTVLKGITALHELAHGIYDYNPYRTVSIIRRHFERNPNNKLEKMISGIYGLHPNMEKGRIIDEEFAYTLSAFACLGRPWHETAELQAIWQRYEEMSVEDIARYLKKKIPSDPMSMPKLFSEIDRLLDSYKVWLANHKKGIRENVVRQRLFQITKEVIELAELPPVRLLDVVFFSKIGIIEPWMNPLALGFTEEDISDINSYVDKEYYLRVIEFLMSMGRPNAKRREGVPYGKEALDSARSLGWKMIEDIMESYGIHSLEELGEDSHKRELFYTEQEIAYICKRIARAELGIGSLDIANVYDNFGKGLAYEINESENTVSINGWKFKTENRSLIDQKVDGIIELAKSLTVAVREPEFISKLENWLRKGEIKIRTYRGKNTTRAAGALGCVKGNIVYLDEILFSNDMAIIHELLHIYLRDRDIERLTAGHDKIETKSREIAGNDRTRYLSYLRHYYARCHLQNSPQRENEKLTEEIKKIIREYRGPLEVIIQMCAGLKPAEIETIRKKYSASYRDGHLLGIPHELVPIMSFMKEQGITEEEVGSVLDMASVWKGGEKGPLVIKKRPAETEEECEKTESLFRPQDLRGKQLNISLDGKRIIFISCDDKGFIWADSENRITEGIGIMPESYRRAGLTIRVNTKGDLYVGYREGEDIRLSIEEEKRKAPENKLAAELMGMLISEFSGQREGGERFLLKMFRAGWPRLALAAKCILENRLGKYAEAVDILRKFFKRHDLVFYSGSKDEYVFGRLVSYIPMRLEGYTEFQRVVFVAPYAVEGYSYGLEPHGVDDEVYVITKDRDPARNKNILYMAVAIHEVQHKVDSLEARKKSLKISMAQKEYTGYMAVLAELGDIPGVVSTFFRDFLFWHWKDWKKRKRQGIATVRMEEHTCAVMWIIRDFAKRFNIPCPYEEILQMNEDAMQRKLTEFSNDLLRIDGLELKKAAGELLEEKYTDIFGYIPPYAKGNILSKYIRSGMMSLSSLSTIKAKARNCSDLDEELVLAIDTDIGNLAMFAQELFTALNELQNALGRNIRIFIGKGKDIEAQLEKYLGEKGDKRDFVISAIIRNKSITEGSLLKGIKDRVKITAVDDKKLENTDNDKLNYIPIVSILELSIKKAMGSVLREEHSNIPNVEGILEHDNMLIIYLSPKASPVPINELRERYKYEAQVLASA